MKALLAASAVLAGAGASAMASSDNDDEFLKLFAETRRFQSGRPVSARPTPDGAAVLFLRGQAKSPQQTLFLFDVATGQTREVLTPEAVLKGEQEKLSVAEKARLERQRVSARGFTSFDLSEDGARILVVLSGKLYAVDRKSFAVQPLATGEGANLDPHFSRDGSHVAYVRDNDLYALDIASNKERRVTTGGSEAVSHGVAEFVAQEEMDRFTGFWWSPDGSQLAFEEADNSKLERFSISDPMHPEATANAFYYPRAGKENARVRLGLVSVRGGAVTWVHWDAAKYPYLATVRWPRAGGPLTILVQNRAQTEEVLYAVDAKTGRTTELLTEKDDAWLNLDQAFPRWLEDGSGFLWYTERNGGPEVELRSPDGKRAASWVKPEAGFEQLVGFDEKSRTLYFAGDSDPTQLHLYKVRDAGAPERIATMDGAGLELGFLSKDGSLLVVQSQSLAAMPHWSVFKSDGTRVGELPSVAVEPQKTTAEIRVVGPDKIRALVLRPRTPHAGKLPVLVDVYGGPGHQVVTQSLGSVLLDQWFADQGFIVVRFDGHGTPRRGRAWERSLRGDFSKTAADQVAALKALGAELPELDLSRVGVQGWSFGGYLSALLLFTHPEVFKASCSGAPVVDWTDYDTHYTERYIGTPQDNAKGYEASSLLTYAPKLSRPLLLIHGTADDNVYFFHTLKLSDALFRAGKKHEVLPLSGFTHMVPDPLVTQRLEQRIAQFFKENL